MQLTPRIGGRPASAEEWIDVLNPYDGSPVARVPALTATHVAEAVAAAEMALGRADLPQPRRAEILERAAELLAERTEEFAVTVAREAGTPIREARAGTARCGRTLRLSAVEARRLAGEVVPVDAAAGGSGRLSFALRRPLGVVAALTSAGDPLDEVAYQVGAAVAAGCPVVLKPARRVPVSAIRLVDLLVEAGLPADWVSVLTGDAGRALVEHPGPALITYTGSAENGRRIRESAPHKRVHTEITGTMPVIVEPDADLARVVAAVPRRLLIHHSIYAEAVARIKAAAAARRVGDPLDEATEVGPVRDADAVGKALAEARTGGAGITGGERRGPTLIAPAVVEGSASVFDGPVQTVTRYADLDEAIALAGHGTAAAIFTGNLAGALGAARALPFDTVLVNQPDAVRPDRLPGAVREMTALRYVMVTP